MKKEYRLFAEGSNETLKVFTVENTPSQGEVIGNAIRDLENETGYNVLWEEVAIQGG